MTEDEKAERLAELKADPPKHMTWSDVFTETKQVLSDTEKASLDEYLRAFVYLDHDAEELHCPCCKNRILGGTNAIFQAGMRGTTKYSWGVGFGEASCDECAWPGRAIHTIGRQDGNGEPIVEDLHLLLIYHPDGIEVAKR